MVMPKMNVATSTKDLVKGAAIAGTGVALVVSSGNNLVRTLGVVMALWGLKDVGNAALDKLAGTGV